MNRDHKAVADMREEYTVGEMHRVDMLADPIEQFRQWFQTATDAGLHEPNALTLSTLGLDGYPAARTVLMKQFDTRGFTVFTNYTSAKAQEMEAIPKASMLFQWLSLERQIRIEGDVEKVSREESQAYYASRPRDSQIGAWVSHQSSVISSRSVLVERQDELEKRFDGQDIPLPDFWGGYRLKPVRIEFWQGRKGRIHDRFLYTKNLVGWQLDRLAP